ncbi:MAG: hypothetical protein KGY75_02970 [Candidatus Cloacimonetes bacterium]|nr:hypothetical protein [Candidatus Cloacimonadota bacterium]MBS3767070.1 hypothetical protein [Candidatus Cloacimonadota bacterium]
MKKILIITLALSFIIFNLNAQNLNTDTDPGSSFNFPSSFINLNKLQTSQSISFTSIMSSDSKPIFISNFQNRFNYELSKNLNLQMDLNIVNYKNSNNDGDFSLQDNSKVLPNFRLDYSPNENFHFRIEYNSSPRTYSPFYYR